MQFKIPNDQLVWVGTYNGEKSEMAASEAAGAFLAHSGAMGLEVVVPRKIMPKEIARGYLAPRITGWRYYPEAKGKNRFATVSFAIVERYGHST